jgi:hypothetical protein
MPAAGALLGPEPKAEDKVGIWIMSAWCGC